MTRITDLETGATAGDSVCPLDPLFRETYRSHIKRLASLSPDLIMIDDDFRLAGHGPAAIGCACPRHLRAFEAACRDAGIGTDGMSREVLARKLFCGLPTAHRRIWLAVMGDTLRDFAADMRRAVDEVNPDVRLGHCACLSTWDQDGIDSITLSRTFAGKTKPFLRLIGAPYWNVIRAFRTRNLGTVINDIRMEKAWCDALGGEVELMAEGDTFPRPRYQTPASMLEAYHQVLTADQFPDILKYMFDAGHAPDYETGYLRLHERKAGLRNALSEAFSDTVGCGIYVCEQMKKWENADCTGLSGYDMFERFTPASANFVSALGLPASYEKTAYTPITLLFGENARNVALSDLKGQHLILDAVSAVLLTVRGFDVGMASHAPMPRPQTEFLPDGDGISVDTGAGFLRIDWKAGAQVLGRYEDNTAGVTLYQRDDGTRVLVYPFDMERVSFDAVMMRHDARRAQIMASALPLALWLPEPRLYLLLRRGEGKMAVGIWNFGRDIALPQRISCPGFAATALRPIGETEATLREDGSVWLESEIPPYCFSGFVLE